MNRIKKIHKVCLLFFLMAALALPACQSDGQDNAISTTTAEEEEVKTATLWYLWTTDAESNKAPFEKTLQQWNEDNPQFQIEAEATENMVYGNKLSTAIAVNEAPDIFYSWGAGYSKRFVESGKVLAIGEYLDDSVFERLHEGTLENFIYDGKLYALPIYMTVGVFYCNQALFEAHDVKIPETFVELIAAIDAFNEASVTPMAVGQADRWTGMYYHNILTIRTAGTELTNAALRGEESFAQEPFKLAAEHLDRLVRRGAFKEDANFMSRDEAEAEFLAGEVAMYYNGNWVAGTLDREGSPVQGDIVARAFPALGVEGGSDTGFLGGAIDTFMISAQTPYEEETVAALATIVENFARESYLAGAMHPAWKVDVDESKLSPLLVEIMDLIDGTDDYVVPWSIYMDPDEGNLVSDSVAGIFSQTITPEEYFQQLQELSD